MQCFGDTSRQDTPVPIPNTVVKLYWADDTWGQPAPGKVGSRRDFALFYLSFFVKANKKTPCGVLLFTATLIIGEILGLPSLLTRRIYIRLPSSVSPDLRISLDTERRYLG